uniref:Collectin-11 n=1 Tax=Magallana gigas TaxID=29159 RepID=K1Q921_MAGGI
MRSLLSVVLVLTLVDHSFLQRQSASYYIGVTDSFLEGQWVYSYARTLIRVRPHWLKGGPDNYHNEDCVEVVSSQSGQWSDVQCTTSLFYICEYDNDKLAEPKTQEEVDFLSQQTVLQGNNSAYNIGVTDLFLEGDWVYAHSRTPVEVALPWTNGGPDNYKEEDCVEIAAFPPYSGQYADKSCPLPSKFICEYSRV